MQSVNIIYVNCCSATVSCSWNVDAGDDKELIFLAILCTLNILCDVIRDVIDKHVYVWRIWLSRQSDCFENDWRKLLQRRVEILNYILINVLDTVDMLSKFSSYVWYTCCRQWNETVHFLCAIFRTYVVDMWLAVEINDTIFYAPPCYAKRILLASPPADWRRQLVRPRITWLSTVQQDLKQHHLTLPEAADLAQNRPLWRMMSTYSATQSWVACQKRRRRPCRNLHYVHLALASNILIIVFVGRQALPTVWWSCVEQ